MDTPIELLTPTTPARLLNDRVIDDLHFGAEWIPKLVEVMRDHLWPDSAFIEADPRLVCQVCGHAPAVAVHFGGHDFVESPPFSSEQINAARAEWRERVVNLPTTEAMKAWQEIHAEKILRMRDLLDRCYVTIAGDIETLGCTGAFTRGLSLDDIKFLRMGLAGSGIGLPCFVPSDRYCFAHEVSGGLQEAQEQHHPERVADISRPLTPEERAHVALVEEVIQNEEGSNAARKMLRGRKLPDGWVRDSDPLAAGALHEVPTSWKCPSHDKLDWKCRYCVAQAIIEGELEPVCLVQNGATTLSGDTRPGSTVAKFIDDMDRAGSTSISVFARVAVYTRKLSR